MNILDVIFPRWCVGCGRCLVSGERFLCLHCLAELPLTRHSFDVPSEKDNLPKAFVKYAPEGLTANIVKAFKYRGNKALALYCGQMMAQHIIYTTGNVTTPDGFFHDIDYIVPVPLTWRRKLHRGYNQSEELAKGISKVTGIPVCTDLVKRIRFDGSQTTRSVMDRIENVNGVFVLKEKDLSPYIGKHVLLVDDVITVGATTRSCSEALYKVPKLKVTVLGFSTAR